MLLSSILFAFCLLNYYGTLGNPNLNPINVEYGGKNKDVAKFSQVHILQKRMEGVNIADIDKSIQKKSVKLKILDSRLKTYDTEAKKKSKNYKIDLNEREKVSQEISELYCSRANYALALRGESSSTKQ
ncbi:hypothetical protein PGTUg99_033399 [Puccinia graminis f. sp. tritici]|uniref:No apical meristem-associated C-terminal domain-containing protein n=1 Tax=Puccinia graminis f. sp. tritici TaxID=56615 RepID=A0A5B0N5N4_PUCGR|nr:hypothetical protein PGTUg99_033399 [Puccinia graminis f. sp. tritici]